MKQLLSLFLFLLPCLAWAQYPSNGNQKITLGEQTTADGLIYRGLAADTTRKPSIDTMAYMVLDTTTNIMWHYKKATSNAWLRLNLLPSDTASMLTNYWRSGRFSGVLPVANGGTNATTLTENKVMVGNATSGVLTPTNLHWDNTNSRLGIGTASPGFNLDVNGTSRMYHNTANAYSAIFYNFNQNGEGLTTRGGSASNHNSLLIQTYDGNINLLKISGTGAATFSSLAGTGSRAVEADLNGVLSAPVSSINYKENVQPLDYGLNELLQINPVSFDYINKDKWGEERNLGFIVEDMFPVIPEVTGTMNNGDMYLDMTKLIPVLTKAIQEQNLLIKALEQRIINLENK